ncbi:MAG: hypothetical protein SVO96_00260 [Pseudomonadota bacterium]|nr:hypothetical protein [Pseudomonadota bacterium]
MLYLALIIFVVVFLGGLLLAYRHFTDEAVPITMAMGHGAGGVLGLVVLYFAASSVGTTALWWAFWLYVLAALGGCSLTVYSRFLGNDAPRFMIVGHGLVAVLGCTALTLGVFGAVTA